MFVLLILLSLLTAGAALFISGLAGIAVMGLALLFALFARMEQASTQHAELLRAVRGEPDGRTLEMMAKAKAPR